MTRGHRAAAGAATLVAAALALAACTTSGEPQSAGTTPAASTPVESAPASSAPPAPSSAPVSSPSATPTPRTSAATTKATTSAPPPVTPTTASPSTCTDVTVRVIPGGAVQGAEIASLQFTNAGSTTCALGDFPTATLLLGGKVVGTPSQPNGRPATTMTLKPGDIAESLLYDYSSCQAPLADSVRITVPGESTTVVRPMRYGLRACTLRVAPLTPPA